MNTSYNTASHNVTGNIYQPGNRGLASVAAAVVLTLAMLMGVNTLAVVDNAAPQLAQTSSAHA